ncbi:MAG: hypothetical protein ACI9UK_001278 [Candidatus Krumholzibacteriia bacterium]
MIGKTLAHYEVTALLGKGGMGEVYLAQDTKLGRNVALKILPPELATDPERVARFAREARTLARPSARQHRCRVGDRSRQARRETSFPSKEVARIKCST